jgi:hypothetical protein
MINWTPIRKLYYKTVNTIKKKFKIFISDKMSSSLNFIGFNILDCDSNITRYDVYYWMNTIDSDKLYNTVKTIFYCYVMIYFSSSHMIQYVKSFYNNNSYQLLYDKQHLRKLLVNKELDKFFESESIYSVYNILKNSNSNKIRNIILEKISRFNFIFITFNVFWTLSSVLGYLNIKSNLIMTIIWLLVKSYFTEISIDSFIIIPLTYLISSTPINLLLIWFFKLSNIYIELCDDFYNSIYYCLSNLLFGFLFWYNPVITIILYLLTTFFVGFLLNRNKTGGFNIKGINIKYATIELLFMNLMILINKFNTSHIIISSLIYYYYQIFYKEKKKIEINIKIVDNHFKKIVRSKSVRSFSSLDLTQLNKSQLIHDNEIKIEAPKPILKEEINETKIESDNQVKFKLPIIRDYF